MVPTKRRGKLNLKTETVRNLSTQEMSAVAGGMYTASNYCSTPDTGCCPTGGECGMSATYCSMQSGKSCYNGVCVGNTNSNAGC